MDHFSEWLDVEMHAALAAIDKIPCEKRKGHNVGLLRLRAREIDCARRIYLEFELCSHHSGRYSAELTLHQTTRI